MKMIFKMKDFLKVRRGNSDAEECHEEENREEEEKVMVMIGEKKPKRKGK